MLALAERTHFHNTRSRNIFPFDMEKVVLYAPLWQEDMQGATLLSYDQYHHLCTVTGAVWGSQGRTFDGTDDSIRVPINNTVFKPSSFTLIAWIKTSSIADVTDTVFDGKVSLNINQNGVGDAAGGYVACWFFTGAAWKSVGSASAVLNTTSFFNLAVTFSRPTLTLYINGVYNNVATQDFALSYDADQAISIGESMIGANDYAGIIGEVLYNSRAWSAGEIAHIHQITKWRYMS